ISTGRSSMEQNDSGNATPPIRPAGESELSLYEQEAVEQIAAGNLKPAAAAPRAARRKPSQKPGRRSVRRTTKSRARAPRGAARRATAGSARRSATKRKR